jgi:hypothetical protein
MARVLAFLWLVLLLVAIVSMTGSGDEADGAKTEANSMGWAG